MSNKIFEKLENIGIDNLAIADALSKQLLAMGLFILGCVIQIETGEYLLSDDEFGFDLDNVEIFEDFYEAKKQGNSLSDTFMVDICLLFNSYDRMGTVLIYSIL